MVRLLLEAGADPAATADNGLSPLQVAVGSGEPEAAQALLRGGAELDVFAAAGLGDVDAVRRMVGEQRELAGAVGAKGRPPLYYAICGDSAETAAALLTAGADPDCSVTIPDGELEHWSLLHLAVVLDRAQIVELLMAAGADLEVPPENTPLRFAARYGMTRVAEALVRGGAKFEWEGHGSLLHYWAALGHVEGVKMLLDRGADPDFRDPEGVSPLGLARENRHGGVAKLLQAALADRGDAKGGMR